MGVLLFWTLLRYLDDDGNDDDGNDDDGNDDDGNDDVGNDDDGNKCWWCQVEG